MRIAFRLLQNIEHSCPRCGYAMEYEAPTKENEPIYMDGCCGAAIKATLIVVENRKFIRVEYTNPPPAELETPDPEPLTQIDPVKQVEQDEDYDW